MQRKIAVVESEQEAKLLATLNKVCTENAKLRAALEQIAKFNENYPANQLAASIGIARDALKG